MIWNAAAARSHANLKVISRVMRLFMFFYLDGGFFRETCFCIEWTISVLFLFILTIFGLNCYKIQ